MADPPHGIKVSGASSLAYLDAGGNLYMEGGDISPCYHLPSR